MLNSLGLTVCMLVLVTKQRHRHLASEMKLLVSDCISELIHTWIWTQYKNAPVELIVLLWKCGFLIFVHDCIQVLNSFSEIPVPLWVLCIRLVIQQFSVNGLRCRDKSVTHLCGKILTLQHKRGPSQYWLQMPHKNACPILKSTEL